MDYMVNLEQFYGPLDLLLYLIEKNEMNIYDIPIAAIADQYMDYLQVAGQIDLDQLGDFLVMAAYLLNLKSQMLLPTVAEDTDKEEEALDPREELVQRLMEYKRFKLAADMLASKLLDDYPRIFFRQGGTELPTAEEEISANAKSLQKAYLRLLEEQFLPEPYQVPQGDINVGEKMAEIQRRLELAGQPVSFYEIYREASSRREVLASFLALLELIRLHKVVAVQDKRFGEIRMVMPC